MSWNDELDDIAWDLGIPREIFRKECDLVREMTVSMWCCTHQDWKHNIDNPICLYCENEKLAVQNEELRRSLKALQTKG